MRQPHRHSRRNQMLRFGAASILATGLVSGTLGSITPAAALEPGKLVAQATPVTAPSNTMWGAPVIGGRWDFPFGTNGDLQNGSGAGSQGLLKMQPLNVAAATLSGVSQRDIKANTCFAIEWSAAVGNGVRFSTVVRHAPGKSSYRATLLVRPNSTANLALVRDVSGQPSTTLIAAEIPQRVDVKPVYCLDMIAEGTDPVSIKARVYPQGATPPEWQASATDTSASRITTPGTVGYIGYSSGNNSDMSQIRLATLNAWELVAGGQNPPPAPPNPVPPPGNQPAYGADPLGSTNYPIPNDPNKVIYVDPASGDPAADVRPTDYLFDRTHTQIMCGHKPDAQRFPLVNRTTASLARAIKWVPDGGTIVMKSGIYREQVMICESKKFTIQSAPGATVWMDGSVPVTGWRQEGTLWVKDGWTTRFDSSPTFTWGAPDGKAPSWQFVNPAFPMAAHPDQVFIDNKSLTQVASKAQVAAGSFFMDYANSKIYLGTNPQGRQVSASTMQFALNFATPGYTVRGIGIRHYATSVPQQGAVRTHPPATQMTFENMIFENNAAAGIQVASDSVKLTKITSRDNGLAGIYSAGTKNLTISQALVTGNNREHFNFAPAAAGIKVGSSSTVTVRNSEVSGNNSTGLWIDEQTRGFTLINNSVVRNADAGVLTEISFTGTIANNVIQDNREYGLWIFGVDEAKVWNNTITGSRHPLMVRQDQRINPQTKSPWVSRRITFSNNIVGNTVPGSKPWCATMCVYDQTNTVSASTMVPQLSGNVYHRTDPGNPSQLFRWPSDPAKPYTTYSSLQAFRAATRLEPTGLELTGVLPVADGVATSELANQAAQVAVAIPADIAAILGVPAGSKVIGPVRR